MSLWPVSNEGTRGLMIGYDHALKAGQDCREALRQVQLRMPASHARKHPYYLASFISDAALQLGDL